MVAVLDELELTATQAQTVIAAVLRRRHAVISTGQAWDPTIATHAKQTPMTSIADADTTDQRWRPGEPSAALRTNQYLDAHHGQPARRLGNPMTRCTDHPNHGYAGTDDGTGTGQGLAQNALR
jgi:hypothetical protein